MSKIEKLGKFGWHPDPVIDFEIEIGSLEARWHSAVHGISKPGTPPETLDAVASSVQEAMNFRVGGREDGVIAKSRLRTLDTVVRRVLSKIPQEAIERPERIADAIEAADWSNVSIGNKAILKTAVVSLRADAARAQGAEVESVGWLMLWADDGSRYGFTQDKSRIDHMRRDKDFTIVDLYTTPPAPQPTEADGIEKAARFIDKQIAEYVQEHGSYDSSTGQTEFSEAGEAYVATLEELAEAIRALANAKA